MVKQTLEEKHNIACVFSPFSGFEDPLIMQALEKSSEELMDILTFVKEIDFEIRDNLGFDVLWDSLNGRRRSNVAASLLEWMGYEGNFKKQKENFVDLFNRNDIEYQEIGFEDPLIEQFLTTSKSGKIGLPSSRSLGPFWKDSDRK
jgi:hypothetical protein